MVDPVQVLAAAVANKVTARAFGAVFGPDLAPASEVGLGNVDAYIALPDNDNGEPIGVVTQGQLADIEKFLASQAVSSLFETYALLSLLHYTEHREAKEAQSGVSRSFCQLANDWCQESRGTSWASLAFDLWQLSTEQLDGITARVGQQITQDDIFSSRSLDYLFCVDFARGKRGNAASNYIRHVADVLRSPGRFQSSTRTVASICEAMRVRYSEITIEHAQEDYRFGATQLYVRRTVERTVSSDSGDKRQVETDVDELFGPHVRRRVVILGDPGVGKSTLVRHVIHKLSQKSDQSVAPMLVTCREYVARFDNTSIADHMLERLRVDHSLAVSITDLGDMFALGRACVIFDGLDEVLDPTQRRALVRRIESFAREFPALTIAATARRIGYSEAQFDEQFEVVSLSEFTYSQFSVYVERWFAATGRPDSREGFIGESTSVADIRLNPLMLSLLCTLYRAREYIPQNRRSVYRECADLLFTRWDSMRKIDQPIEHRQYGNKLMQEIALLFFGNQAAQAGLEEGQLQGIIAHFFQDTAGVERDESLSRAKKFLDFCSGRAWLLSMKGTTKRGVRLFAFTHRTFMEYYAAEALVRRAANVAEISHWVITAFRSNPSSVLPDVMTQAADDVIDRGAEKILRELFSWGKRNIRPAEADKFLSLCLRIVNASPMSRGASELLRPNIMALWSIGGDINNSHNSTIALFELYRDARAKIIRAMNDRTSESKLFAHEVLRRWARLQLFREFTPFEEEWAADLDSLLGQRYATVPSALGVLDREYVTAVDPILVDTLLLNGKIDPGFKLPDGSYAEPLLVASAFWKTAPASIMRIVVSAICGEVELLANHHVGLMGYFQKNLSPFRKLPEEYRSHLFSVLDHENVKWTHRHEIDLPALERRIAGISEVLLWISLATYESWGELRGLSRSVVRQTVGINSFDRACDHRSEGVGHLWTKSSIRTTFRRFGPWAEHWADGECLT